MLGLIRNVSRHRSLIAILALKTLRARYAGTIGGALWAVAAPAATVAVFWLVFSVGFRVKPPGDAPFIVLFLCGFLPWTVLAETLALNTTSITSNAHFLKRTIFPAEILAVANLCAALIVHSAMLVLLVVVISASGLPVGPSSVRFVFHLAGLCILAVGLSWALSAINVFYRDVASVLSVLLNLWFWLTPISWTLELMPERWERLFRLNPMLYVVEGYQSAFLGRPPANAPYFEAYFWLVCLAAFAAGAFLFDRLKSEFADLL